MKTWYSKLSLAILGSSVTLAMVGGYSAIERKFFPEYHQVKKLRGCDVIYDISGRVYVESNTRNMIKYLRKEDSDVLTYEILSLEKRLEEKE